MLDAGAACAYSTSYIVPLTACDVSWPPQQPSSAEETDGAGIAFRGSEGSGKLLRNSVGDAAIRRKAISHLYTTGTSLPRLFSRRADMNRQEIEHSGGLPAARHVYSP